MSIKLKIVILLIVTVTKTVYGWGFHAHKLINRHAVYALPNNSLFGFFKSNIEYLSENAVNADKRRYIQEEEACRHYIDLDSYAEMGMKQLPKYFSEATTLLAEETLKAHGVLPWHIAKVQYNLTKAMADKNAEQILRMAADLGHYVGDANVPLHTTHNYDGQLTNQKGIHALWETRVPELYSTQYNYLTGRAEYVKDIQSLAWKTINESNAAVDSVLSNEAKLSAQFKEDEKYAFEERNMTTVRTYSKHFSEKYSESLNGQVERQMTKAIKMVADLWYTSWVDAGQPDLSTLHITNLNEKDSNNSDKKVKNERFLESHRLCDHDFTHTLLVSSPHTEY